MRLYGGELKMGKVRLCVDSVWDTDIVVLVSTDNKTEKAIKFEKDAFQLLVENRRGFMRTVRIGGVDVRTLKRKLEGKVAIFPATDNNFFVRLVEEFQRPLGTVDESLVSIVGQDDLQRLRKSE